jgi:hypothetical protein
MFESREAAMKAGRAVLRGMKDQRIPKWLKPVSGGKEPPRRGTERA